MSEESETYFCGNCKCETDTGAPCEECGHESEYDTMLAAKNARITELEELLIEFSKALEDGPSNMSWYASEKLLDAAKLLLTPTPAQKL